MRSITSLSIAAAALALALPAAAQTTTGAAATPPADESTASAGSADAEATDTSASASASAQADAPTPGAAAAVTAGLEVKDNTGATIGQVADVKPSGGKQVATIKMGAESFAVDTASLAVADGAATINATQAELKDMLKKAGGGSAGAGSSSDTGS